MVGGSMGSGRRWGSGQGSQARADGAGVTRFGSALALLGLADGTGGEDSAAPEHGGLLRLDSGGKRHDAQIGIYGIGSFGCFHIRLLQQAVLPQGLSKVGGSVSARSRPLTQGCPTRRAIKNQ